MLERLQKIISRAGIASRRHAEQLIRSGAVTVNGRVVTELGTKADAARDHITVGPRTVKLAETPERYMAFYKPARVVSTMSDPEGRPCLGPYLRGFGGRLFAVGRLDFDAAGLLVLTSDGALASDLMRGAAVVPQTWRFKVKGRIPEDAQRGIERAARVRLRVYRDAANAWYEAELGPALSLRSGSRSVSGGPRGRLEEALLRNGVLVEKSVRWGLAGVTLDGLGPGEMRELTREEVNSLRRAVAGRKNEIRKTKNDKRKSVRSAGGDEMDHGRNVAVEAAGPRNERPERAALARAVEEWRAGRRRRIRDGAAGQSARRYEIGRSKQRPYGGAGDEQGAYSAGRDGNRNRGRRKG